MAQFNLSADIKEVNHYEFAINAATEKEARNKLLEYLHINTPLPFHGDINTGVTCIEKETGIKTLVIEK